MPLEIAREDNKLDCVGVLENNQVELSYSTRNTLLTNEVESLRASLLRLDMEKVNIIVA